MPSNRPHQAGLAPAHIAPDFPAFLSAPQHVGVPAPSRSSPSSHPEWLEVEVALVGDHPTVVLSGELDMASAPLLRRHLEPVVARGGDVVIDLAGVDFLGCAGLAVLMDAARGLAERGGRLRLRSARPIIATTIAILGLEDVLGMAA